MHSENSYFSLFLKQFNHINRLQVMRQMRFQAHSLAWRTSAVPVVAGVQCTLSDWRMEMAYACLKLLYAGVVFCSIFRVPQIELSLLSFQILFWWIQIGSFTAVKMVYGFDR